MQAIRALSSIGSCGSTTPLVGSEMKDTAASGSDALHLVVDLGALPVCELVEPLERLVMARLACKPLEQLLVRAQPSAKGALAELSPSAAKPLLVAYIQFVLQLHRVPHIKSSVREVLALHLGDTIVAAGPSWYVTTDILVCLYSYISVCTCKYEYVHLIIVCVLSILLMLLCGYVVSRL